MRFKSFCGARWPDKLMEYVMTILVVHTTLTERSRIPRLLSAKGAKPPRYTVWSVPPKEQLTWTKPSRDSLIEQLVLKSDEQRPLKFWTVGEVVSEGAWLVGPDGVWRSRVSIEIRPIRDGEADKWDEFVNSFGGWKSTFSFNPLCRLLTHFVGKESTLEDGQDKTFLASRYMAYRAKGETKPTV